MKTMSRFLATLCGLALVACDAIGPQFGTVNVYLTDAPGSITSATISTGRVYLVPGEDGTEPGFTITSAAAQYDLLELQDGVTALMGTASIPVGDYAQLRLVVTSAHVELDDGGEFDLKVPSGMESGLKVLFAPPVHVEPGVTNIVVDFDASESFVVTPPDDPRGVIFRPVIRATVQ